MNFFTKSIFLKKSTVYISFIMIFFLVNHLKALGSEKRQHLFRSKIIEKIYNQNSIPISEYDNFNNQLRTFLGLYSTSANKSYFPDLMLINDSKSFRNFYNSKLNDMTFNKNIYIIENKRFFKY